MPSPLSLLATALAFSAPAERNDGVPPEPTATTASNESPPRRFPDGRLEFVARGGWIIFDRDTALKARPTIGGELAHHFDLDNRLFGVGAFVGVDGALTEIKGTSRGVDVIALSAGTMFSYRALRRLMPTLRGGAGFVLVDGTKSSLPVRGRGTFHAALGLRYFPIDWLVLRAGAGLLVHDNAQIGAGSGKFGTVAHWMFTAGLGVVR